MAVPFCVPGERVLARVYRNVRMKHFEPNGYADVPFLRIAYIRTPT